MGQAYVDELLPDRHAILMQMQGYVASSDPEIQAHVRALRPLVAEVTRLSGAAPRMSGASSRTACCSTSRSRSTSRRSPARASGRRLVAGRAASPATPDGVDARRGSPASIDRRRRAVLVAAVAGRVRRRRVRRPGRRAARHRRRLRRPAVGVDPGARHDRARHRALGGARRDRAGPARRAGRHAARRERKLARGRRARIARRRRRRRAALPRRRAAPPLVSRGPPLDLRAGHLLRRADEDDGGRRAERAPARASRA